MPSVPSWDPPQVFTLTNPYSGTLQFNVQTALGYLTLDKKSKFRIGVRSTKTHVPQGDGDILHYRFLSGSEMDLIIHLWDNDEQPACDGVLEDLVDLVTGSFRSLLNAGDNQGRLAWTIPSGGNTRMLDDCRLLVYPDLDNNDNGTDPIVRVTIDSEFPYAQDLTEATPNACADGASVNLNNTGTADYWPVFRIAAGATAFTLTNATTGLQIVYDSSLPDAVPIGGAYGELNTFKNTFFQDGDGADLFAGIDEENSEFFPLIPGLNTISIAGASTTILWAPAWG